MTIHTPYYSFNQYLQETFGEKIYKLALDGGMTCPNRDGTVGTGGCIFCSEGGSGDFAVSVHDSVWQQIELAKKKVAKKIQNGKYIAYFQSFTNTYAPVSYLEKIFTEAVSHPDIAALSIATRPDCLPDEVLALLVRLNESKPVWIELGLQTIHESTAQFIRRGYPLSCYENAFTRLKQLHIPVITHVILGLPGESREQMKETVSWLGHLHTDGIKLQLLHILKGTDLASYYQKNPFHIFSMEEYIDLVIDCIELLPEDIVIHRLTGDGPKSLLIEPQWSSNKRVVLNSMAKRLKERKAYQGHDYRPDILSSLNYVPL